MDVTVALSGIGLKSEALQAASIQGFLALVGIVVTGIIGSFAYGRARRADRRVQRLLREEKTRDLQSAIRAEVRAHWYELDAYGSLEAMRDATITKIEEGRWAVPPYQPFVPREAPSLLFGTVGGDIAILDHDVVAATVLYYRQLALVAQFSEDLRSELFATLPGDRKVNMVATYFHMLRGLKNVAAQLNATLEAALALRKRDVNIRVEDQP